MSKSIFELVDNLPTGGLTVMSLNALDFVIPGQWQNIVGFDNTIKIVTGTDDPEYIQAIGERAVALYNDNGEGYQTAMWLYNTVDTGSKALGAAAMASKVGESFSMLSFLGNITPKAETAQTIDLSVKLVAEIVAFCQINGMLQAYPFSWASDPEYSAKLAPAIREDLVAVHDSFQLQFPVVAMVTELDAISGMKDFLLRSERLHPGLRLSRAGSSCRNSASPAARTAPDPRGATRR